MAVETTPPLIPLQGSTNFKQPLPEPKFIKSEREYLANYYLIKEVIEGVDSWHYYPVKISKVKKGNFYKLEVTPPVFREGIVCIEKNFINVPLNDLIRRQINVTRICDSISTSTSTTTETSIPTQRKPSVSSIESGPSDLIGDQERKDIDLAFQNQIDALHYLEDSEESFWKI